ncbi:MAG: 30S ribosomal protein S16 [bacterium]|nr:30S ribosomal protein S16 [bacterium]
MLVIRLFRVGKKNQPFFKIVVTDKRKPPRAGRFVEEVGFYNPLTKEKVLKGERIKYWLSVGVKPSKTIHNLLIKEKIIEGKKTPVHKKAKKEKEAVPEKPAKEKPVEEKPKEEKPIEQKPKEEKPKKEKPKEEKKEELPKTE